MPIRREHRFFYPIDWRELSREIRFRRAGGACEGCGRPHGRVVVHLGDGRCWDPEVGAWRDGQGMSFAWLPTLAELTGGLRTTRVVLATAHRNTTRRTTGPGTSWRGASAATWTTTSRSIAGTGGEPCSGDVRWATYSGGATRRPDVTRGAPTGVAPTRSHPFRSGSPQDSSEGA